RNTIVAENLNFFGQSFDTSGAFDSRGYNLIGATNDSSGFGAEGDLLGPDGFLLAPLDDNGGPTLTHALLTNSPAIDAGITNDVPATDQRGFPRPAPGKSPRADIGAFEYVKVNIPRLPGKIGDQDIAANTQLGPLPFTVEDDETPGASLVVIVSSSNTNLVPNEAIVQKGGPQA